jgi:hypothetical protein
MRWLSINEVSDALGVTVGRVRQLSIALDVAGEPGVRKNPDGRKNWEWEESLVDEAKNAKKRKDLIPTQREKSWEDYEHLPDMGYSVELPDGSVLGRFSSDTYQLFERELLALPKLREAVSTLTEEEKRLNQELSTLNTEYSMLDAITQERVRHLQLRIDKNQEEIDWLRIQFTKTMEQLKSTIQVMSQRNYIEASEILKDK